MVELVVTVGEAVGAVADFSLEVAGRALGSVFCSFLDSESALLARCESFL